MHRSIKYIFFITLVSLAVSYCSESGTGSGDDGGGETVSLTTSTTPDDAGTVSPSSGDFEKGTEITVEATRANKAWGFDVWSGDLSSSENPLTFTIDSDTDLTANFNAVGSIYQVNMTLSDSLNSMDLDFGQTDGASQGYDSGIDHESPPPPPDQNALHAFFKIQDLELLKDFRAVQANSLTWNIQIDIGTGDSLSLSWTLNTTALNGSLTLKNADGSTSVDMTSNSSVDFSAAEADSLVIEYQLTSN